MEHIIFYVEIQIGKPRGGGRKFTIICGFIGIAVIEWCVLSLNWVEGEKDLFVRWRGRSICTEVLTVKKSWRCFCMIFVCGFIVRTVIMDAGLLGLHAGNIFIVHHCPPRMQGRCTSSMWEIGTGMIVGGDLGGHYWKLLVCGEVKNLIYWWFRRVMPPEWEVAPGWGETFWNKNTVKMW